MLLLAIFAFILRLLDAGSGSSDEEYGNETTASSGHIQNSERLASSESAQCPTYGLCFQNNRIHLSSQKPFSCSQCYKQFSHANSLRRHQRTHSGEKPYNCSICGKQFFRSCTLRIHQQTHVDIKLFRCAECGKHFAYANRLRTHQRKHTGEKPFKCPECGKQFARTDHLKIHRRIHTGVKPFRCTECGKHFARSDHLSKHQLMHADEKPFKCLKCEKSFTRSDRLKVHQQKKHADLDNSTDNPSIGFVKNFSVREGPSLFQTVFVNSGHNSLLIRLVNPIVSNYPSIVQIEPENFGENQSFEIKNLTVRENPSLLHAVPKIPANATSHIEGQVPGKMKDPFLLQNAVKNSVDSSSFTETDNLTELENPFLVHMENPMDHPPFPENPMEGSSHDHIQDPITFGDPFLFQNSMHNPSLMQTKEYTVLEKLISSPPLVRSDRHSAPQTSLDSALFAQIQEHIAKNAGSSLPDDQLLSSYLDAVAGSTYLECPVCFGRYSGREALKEHLLNSVCSLFPELNWLPYLESVDDDDLAK